MVRGDVGAPVRRGLESVSCRALDGVQAESFGGGEELSGSLCPFGCVGGSDPEVFESRPECAVAFEEEATALEFGDG